MLHFDCTVAIKSWVDVKNHRGRVVYFICVICTDFHSFTLLLLVVVWQDINASSKE